MSALVAIEDNEDFGLFLKNGKYLDTLQPEATLSIVLARGRGWHFAMQAMHKQP